MSDQPLPKREYAIFRTRFQPATLGHTWAIKTFLDWANSEYTFGAEHLILAVVDPNLEANPKVLDRNPRLQPQLNPLNDWVSATMAHALRCSTKELVISGEGPSPCESIVITSIPSFGCLRDGDSNTIKNVKEAWSQRLPLGDKAVWYFPCFDKEDIVDITGLWTAMKADNSFPKMPVVVSHNDRFVFQHHGEQLGIYAQAMCELSMFEQEGWAAQEGQAISQEVREAILRICSSGTQNDIISRLRELRGETERTDSDLYRNKCFDYEGALDLSGELKNSCLLAFGTEWHRYLSFLPPDAKSPVAQRFLSAPVHDVLCDSGLWDGEVKLDDQSQTRIQQLKEEIENPYPATTPRAIEIITEVTSLSNRLASRKKSLIDKCNSWPDGLRAALDRV